MLTTGPPKPSIQEPRGKRNYVEVRDHKISETSSGLNGIYITTRATENLYSSWNLENSNFASHSVDMPVVYGTRNLIGMFARTGHWTLTWATSIQFTYSHQHRSDHPDNIWWRIPILKPLTRQFSPTSNFYKRQGNSVSMVTIKTFIFRNVTACHQDNEGNMILRNFGAFYDSVRRHISEAEDVLSHRQESKSLYCEGLTARQSAIVCRISTSSPSAHTLQGLPVLWPMVFGVTFFW